MAKKKKPIRMSNEPKIWGYARVSTYDQDMRMQIQALEGYGCDAIFKEKASGVDMDRAILNWMLDEIYLRGGDTIVVWKLDRLGRSVKGLIEVVELIKERGARLVSLNDHIDTETANGRLLFNVIASVAQWERDMISERTKAGMAAAVAAGKKLGPKHSIRDNPKRMKHMRKLDKEGRLRDEEGKAGLLDADLLAELNKADPSKKIESMETVRRWRREGYPGLEDD